MFDINVSIEKLIPNLLGQKVIHLMECYDKNSKF